MNKNINKNIQEFFKDYFNVQEATFKNNRRNEYKLYNNNIIKFYYNNKIITEHNTNNNKKNDYYLFYKDNNNEVRGEKIYNKKTVNIIKNEDRKDKKTTQEKKNIIEFIFKNEKDILNYYKQFVDDIYNDELKEKALKNLKNNLKTEKLKTYKQLFNIRNFMIDYHLEKEQEKHIINKINNSDNNYEIRRIGLTDKPPLFYLNKRKRIKEINKKYGDKRSVVDFIIIEKNNKENIFKKDELSGLKNKKIEEKLLKNKEKIKKVFFVEMKSSWWDYDSTSFDMKIKFHLKALNKIKKFKNSKFYKNIENNFKTSLKILHVMIRKSFIIDLKDFEKHSYFVENKQHFEDNGGKKECSLKYADKYMILNLKNESEKYLNKRTGNYDKIKYYNKIKYK